MIEVKHRLSRSPEGRMITDFSRFRIIPSDRSRAPSIQILLRILPLSTYSSFHSNECTETFITHTHRERERERERRYSDTGTKSNEYLSYNEFDGTAFSTVIRFIEGWRRFSKEQRATRKSLKRKKKEEREREEEEKRKKNADSRLRKTRRVTRSW